MKSAHVKLTKSADVKIDMFRWAHIFAGSHNLKALRRSLGMWPHTVVVLQGSMQTKSSQSYSVVAKCGCTKYTIFMYVRIGFTM